MANTTRGLGLGFACVAAMGCSVILDPARHDDVPRCRYDDDCPEPDDVRYTHVCTVAETFEDPDFPKICSPRPSVSCDPDDYDYDSTFRTRIREASSRDEHYVDECADLGGVQGCIPDSEGCAAGLSPHPASGRCDDDDPETPPAIAPQPSVATQDVLDQFCRSVFCDSRFVCDLGTRTCNVCELGRGIGHGGCGDLYPQGHRSSIYLPDDLMQDACGGPDGDPQDAAIGAFED